MSEPIVDLQSNYMASPQPRRMYTPIAPLPLETPRSYGTKRLREVEEEETIDEPKRRKRSDSNVSTQFELSDEDRLLLQLKEEESMPWKDIAARFQTDLNKNYQIPALQMRLKRLRERMRVWTETDIRALRMAHEYWVQNKFEIIAQKVSFANITLKHAVVNNVRCSNMAHKRNGLHGNARANGKRWTQHRYRTSTSSGTSSKALLLTQ
jgi:hypothetical protein